MQFLQISRNKVENDDILFFPVIDFSIFANFICGHDDLDDFIKNDAKIHAEELIAITYALVVKENESLSAPIAFASLLNDSIRLPNKTRRHINRVCLYPSYPAVKIGRLGVHNSLKFKGIGTNVLKLIYSMLRTENRTGCRILTLDAYQEATKFYEKNGFQYLTEHDAQNKTRQMYLDLLRVRF